MRRSRVVSVVAGSEASLESANASFVPRGPRLSWTVKGVLNVETRINLLPRYADQILTCRLNKEHTAARGCAIDQAAKCRRVVPLIAFRILDRIHIDNSTGEDMQHCLQEDHHKRAKKRARAHAHFSNNQTDLTHCLTLAKILRRGEAISCICTA